MDDLLLRPEVLWFLAGLILLGGELMTSGFVIIFFGFGAWAVSGVCFFFDPGLDAQLTIFLSISLLLLFTLRKSLSSVFTGDRDGLSALDMDDFKGKRAVVTSIIKPGIGGKVNFRGSNWDADSDHIIESDKTVIITGKESIRLIVEPITELKDKKES